MKILLYFFIFWSTIPLAISQIAPFYGIMDIDSCTMDVPCDYILIDTAANNIWQIGTPNKPFFNTASSPPNAIMTDTIDSYTIGNHSYFELVVPFNIYLFGNMILSFDHKFQTDSMIDGGYIEISYDKGQTWNNVLYDDTINNPIFFNTENLYTGSDTLDGGIHGFSGTSDWMTTKIQWVWLLPLRTIDDTLIFRFHFISDSIQTFKDGWMIDNIKLSYADLGSSVKEICMDEKLIVISPNPAGEVINVKWHGSVYGPNSILIYNSTGQLVRKLENIYEQEMLLNRDGLSSGIYFIYLKNNDSIIGAQKVILK